MYAEQLVMDLFHSTLPFKLWTHPFQPTITFEALYCWTSTKGGAHIHFIDPSYSCVYKVCISHALNGSSAIQCFKCSVGLKIHMWQSHVEIEGCFVAYFDCITVFKVPYRWTSVKGGAHTCFVDAWISSRSVKHVYITTYSGTSEKGTLWGNGLCPL